MILAQADPRFFRWDWVWSHLDDIWEKLVEHLVLTGIAIGVGFIISLVLSAIALRFRRTYPPITWVTGALYTIPSLALFAFLVPITGFFGARQLSALYGIEVDSPDPEILMRHRAVRFGILGVFFA